MLVHAPPRPGWRVSVSHGSRALYCGLGPGQSGLDVLAVRARATVAISKTATLYRETNANVFNLLSRYEFRFEDTLGLPPGLAARRDVHTVSTHIDGHPSRRWTLSGQHAAKWATDRAAAPVVRTLTHLLSGRVGYDVTERIDLGADEVRRRDLQSPGPRERTVRPRGRRMGRLAHLATTPFFMTVSLE